MWDAIGNRQFGGQQGLETTNNRYEFIQAGDRSIFACAGVAPDIYPRYCFNAVTPSEVSDSCEFLSICGYSPSFLNRLFTSLR